MRLTRTWGVTALVAVFWALGLMAIARVPFDVFNATTPILILAIAAGHAVQILKRYYEEYGRLRRTTSLDPREANREAVVASLTKIGPVMIAAGVIAAASFFSLIVFEMQTLRTFGVFTAPGILSALVIEFTLIPAVRAVGAGKPFFSPAVTGVLIEDYVRQLQQRLAGLTAQPSGAAPHGGILVLQGGFECEAGERVLEQRPFGPRDRPRIGFDEEQCDLGELVHLALRCLVGLQATTPQLAGGRMRNRSERPSQSVYSRAPSMDQREGSTWVEDIGNESLSLRRSRWASRRRAGCATIRRPTGSGRCR